MDIEKVKFRGRKLSDKRETADSAVAQERMRLDTAINREGGPCESMVSDLLGKEREETDKRLSDERFQADTEANRSLNLLSNELAAHKATKDALTTRDEFLAIVSHDLRNPIGAIASCADILLEGSSFQNLDPEAKNWITFIKRSADTALALIRDLLDMERLVEGKVQLDLKTYDIGCIVKEVAESFIHAASAKGVFLHVTPMETPVEVRCDHDRILQVLSNLIGNALKFTPQGGSVTLNINISMEEVQVLVKDTGPGIPQDKQAQIFERFTQLGVSGRNGLGLGLYISKMLLEVHRGRLWVESEVGKGSAFIFALPKFEFH